MARRLSPWRSKGKSPLAMNSIADCYRNWRAAAGVPMVLLPPGAILPTGVMVSYAARWHAQPRLIQGRQRESLQTRFVAFFAAASRGAAAIMIVYRLHGER